MVTIYALTCTINGNAYVGSTKGTPEKRLREHRCLLHAGAHKCERLQADWTAHGGAKFRLDRLQQMADACLPARREAELTWMDRFASKGLLYNEHRISMRPLESARVKGVANAHLSPGLRWTPEANLKRSLAQKGKPKGHGAKISATKRAKREQAMR